MLIKIGILFAYLVSMVVPNPYVKPDDIPITEFNFAYIPEDLTNTVEISTSFTLESIAIDSASVDRVDSFALPIDWDKIDIGAWSRYHHDYPAIDIGVPVGTPVYVVRGGTVTTATPSDGGACGGSVVIETDIGRLIYCHLSKVVVSSGHIETGAILGYSGGRPGARGAGSSTTPHLHLAISRYGKLWCPQPLLVSIFEGKEPNLTNTTRCFY